MMDNQSESSAQGVEANAMATSPTNYGQYHQFFYKKTFSCTVDWSVHRVGDVARVLSVLVFKHTPRVYAN